MPALIGNLVLSLDNGNLVISLDNGNLVISLVTQRHVVAVTVPARLTGAPTCTPIYSLAPPPPGAVRRWRRCDACRPPE